MQVDRSDIRFKTIEQITWYHSSAKGPPEIREMSTEVIYGDRSSQATTAKAEGDNLWLNAAELAKISGLELKPEGVCKGDVCVPIPAGREADFVRNNRQSFNLASFARLMGQPTLHE
jgi:hypothetical protein